MRNNIFLEILSPAKPFLFCAKSLSSTKDNVLPQECPLIKQREPHTHPCYYGSVLFVPLSQVATIHLKSMLKMRKNQLIPVPVGSNLASLTKYFTFFDVDVPLLGMV